MGHHGRFAQVFVLMVLGAWLPALPAVELSGLLHPGQRATIAYPELGTPLVGGVAQVVIGLPPGFDPAKSYGIYLWYNGGGGGAGIDDTFSFPDRQIVLSLPLFRRAPTEPIPPDLTGQSELHPGDTHLEQFDWYKNYLALMTVLQDLHKVAPHVDQEMSYCGGYSNGGHNVGFMAAHCPGFCAQFKGYLFIEGGYDGYHELSSVKFLTGSDRAVYAAGGETSSAGSMRAGILDACTAAKIDVTFLFQPGVGHSYDPKYTPQTRAWLESHIFNPGLAEDLDALDQLLSHKRYGDAVRACRAAISVIRPGNPDQARIDSALASLDAAAAPVIQRTNLATASPSQLRHLLDQWAPCPATAPVRAQFGTLAGLALAKLPSGSGREAAGNLRRFLKDWAGTPACSQALAQLDQLAAIELTKALALPSGTRQVGALLAVARLWPEVPTGSAAQVQAEALMAQLLHQAQASKDVAGRGRQEIALAKLMPQSLIGELAMDDVLVLSRQMAN